jgi:hypothetical protein
MPSNNPTRNEYLAVLANPKDTRNATFNQGAFLAGVDYTITSGSSDYVVLTTGNAEIVFSGFDVLTSSGNATIQLFEGPTFTGGQTLEIYNTNLNSNKIPAITEALFNGTPALSVTSDGILKAPPFAIAGDNAARRQLQVFQDIPFILEPNTTYALKITHLDSGARQFSILFSAYENIVPNTTFGQTEAAP